MTVEEVARRQQGEALILLDVREPLEMALSPVVTFSLLY